MLVALRKELNKQHFDLVIECNKHKHFLCRQFKLKNFIKSINS
ncbi:MAG: hypothetical protein Rpha_0336 [Candidatus Ruthia sp. Apha_13_S6]|nr:hypothetical protein [Candidatus Ruthia sp. Apha_13_S6]